MVAINPPRIIAVLMIAFVWFTIWEPPVPLLPVIDWRWFTLGGFSFIAFLIQGNRIILNEAASIGIVIITLITLGGLLGVLRSPEHQNIILWQTVGAIVGLVTHILFMQLLIYDKVRKLLIVTILVAGTFWSIEIFSRTLTLGDLARLSFNNLGEINSDKNYLSLLLAFCVVTLLILFLYWEKPKTWNKSTYQLTRFSIIGVVVFGIFAASLTYSRSGLLTIILSSTIVVIIFMVTQRRSRVEIILTSIIAIMSFVTLFADDYLEAFPFWNENIDRLIGEESYEFNRGRYDTLNKSLLLWQENPVIGTGAGTYRLIVVDLGHTVEVNATAHNTYLAIAVETGILGLVALIIWLLLYFKMLLRHFNKFSLTDRILLHSYIPLFLMMFFLDMLGVMYFYVTLFSTIYFTYNSTRIKEFPQLAPKTD